MKKIRLVSKKNRSKMLQMMIKEVEKYVEIEPVKGNVKCQNEKILIAVDLNEIGEDFEVMKIINDMVKLGKDSLKNSVVIIFVYSPNELNTKEITKKIIYIVNNLGATILGQPLIECMGKLENLRKWAKSLYLSREETLLFLSRKAIDKLINYQPKLIKSPKLLVLHANSNESISNTHLFWKKVESYLDIDYEVIHVEDGTVLDCHGCSFNTCKYYAQQNSCFYGGIMVEEILPAIEKSDAILWLVPNYNDAISAKLMAVINRLTVLYLKHPIMDKNIFSIVVSGNSGSDSVIKQLIGALNVNKGFRLPPYFSIHTIANNPKEILEHENLDAMAKEFALLINKESHYI